MTKKIQRNSPCPCGSGKKYKKCCLRNDEQRVENKHNTETVALNKNNLQEIAEFYAETDALNELSNSVVDFIHEGNLDEAENACNELIKNYPDDVDGIERFAMLYEARGDNEKAIEYYKKTAEFAQSNEGFDSEFVKWALDKVKELEG